MVTKVPCNVCHSDILPTTYAKTRGLCMDCLKLKKLEAEKKRQKTLEQRRKEKAIEADARPVISRTIDLQTAQPIVRFASLLFMGETAATAEFADILKRPRLFIREYEDELDYDEDEKISQWELLIDFARIHRWLWQVDWKESVEEIVAGLRDLIPSKTFSFDWNQAMIECDKDDTLKCLRSLSALIKQRRFDLVALDRDCDNYPLALVRSEELPHALQLVATIKEAKLIQFD